MNRTVISHPNGADWSPVTNTFRDGVIQMDFVFVGPDGNPATIQTTAPTPSVTITSGRTGDAKVSAAALTSVNTPTGHGGYTFWTTEWEEGLYTFKAAAELSDNTPVTIEGGFNMYAPTIEEGVVYRVKSRLKDLEPALYRLDMPVPKWNIGELFFEIQHALMFLNNTGQMSTSFSLETCPRMDLIVEFAFAQACRSMAILENFNTLQLADGAANLTISRAALLNSMADAAMARVEKSTISWKASLRPRIKGQGTALFPFQIRRVIGFLPNMKQVFG